MAAGREVKLWGCDEGCSTSTRRGGDQPDGKCCICGEPMDVEYNDDPAAFLQLAEDSGLYLPGELDQLQSEARDTGQDVGQVMLWDAVADMELGEMLRRGNGVG
jgi:hypothetical protein